MNVFAAVAALKKAGYKVELDECQNAYQNLYVQTKVGEHVMTVVLEKGYAKEETINKLVAYAAT